MASEADLTRLSQELNRELEWFSNVDDVEGLASVLRARVRDGDLKPEILLQVERENRERWLPFMRLAVLEALCEPAAEGRPWDTFEMPSDLLGTFLAAHAHALYDAGFYQLAFDRVSEALASSDAARQPHYLLSLRGHCALAIGDFHGARTSARLLPA